MGVLVLPAAELSRPRAPIRRSWRRSGAVPSRALCPWESRCGRPASSPTDWGTSFSLTRDYLIGGHPWTYRSYALKVYFNKSGVLRAEIIPCTIDGEGFPKIAVRSSAAEILGGIGRASARLRNDVLLAWVERDRTVRDTMSFFASFQGSDAASGAETGSSGCDRRFSRTTFAAYGLDFGAAGERLAAFMQQVAESSVDPQLSASLSKESRADEIVSARASLRSANPIPEDYRGAFRRGTKTDKLWANQFP